MANEYVVDPVVSFGKPKVECASSSFFSFRWRPPSTHRRAGT